MHELSLCRAIADTATEHADGRLVQRINLQIGHFRQVIPETLQFCWQMRAEGTVLDGCELAIDHMPATIECRACGSLTTLTHPILRCAKCDSTEVELKSGEEFLIVSIDLKPEQTSRQVD
ncbi:MAG: hydrogenase maturation nickel metallochaperone HypA [Acidimicrobiales bacterium]